MKRHLAMHHSSTESGASDTIKLIPLHRQNGEHPSALNARRPKRSLSMKQRPLSPRVDCGDRGAHNHPLHHPTVVRCMSRDRTSDTRSNQEYYWEKENNNGMPKTKKQESHVGQRPPFRALRHSFRKCG